jgi:hypothetical protein
VAKATPLQNVRVREHDGVQLLRRQCQVRVDLASLLPVPLKRPAVEQDYFVLRIPDDAKSR